MLLTIQNLRSDMPNRFIIMRKIAIICVLLVLVASAPAADKMNGVPGFPSTYNTSVYSGYLDTASTNRSLHYVFVESVNGEGNNDPVTLWLNGGPGCSSLLGFLQQIGPYYLQDGIDYKKGDNLTENKYSWHLSSNLLFLESPAGVGFSVNSDPTFEHNDATTAYDSLKAVENFFSKYPEYQFRKFFIAGESYAGKYIPDLAVQIDGYNLRKEGPTINLVSILIGNGVMSFQTLQKSTYQFMINRQFVDPQITPIYSSSCQIDPNSAGCRFFEIQYRKGTEELNPYNVYGYCYYNDSYDLSRSQPRKHYASQQSILEDLKQKFATDDSIPSRFNGAPCAFFDGLNQYFTLNSVEYKAKYPDKRWNGPCADNVTYHVDPAGSMASYRYLLGLLPTTRKITIHLYNGNWDAVVPYLDTLKGIKMLNLVEAWLYNPIFVEGQHAGFEQLFSGINFVIFKGASHQVPQTKRTAAFDLFDSIIKGHGSFQSTSYTAEQ